MIQRTFTRGIGDAGLPNCPRCGTAMTAINGVAVADAFAAAEASLQQASGERQLAIPGLKPPFDYRSAFEAIIAQRVVVRRAEAVAEEKARVAKSAKQNADEEQNELSQLEDDFEERVKELAALPPDGKCWFEHATGTPCPLCSNGEPKEDRATIPHFTTVVRSLAAAEDLRPNDLVIALQEIARRFLDRGEVEQWSRAELKAVATWLDMPDKVGQPKVLGRAHVVGEDGDHCMECGTSLKARAEASGFDQWPPESHIGTDCPGKGKKRRKKQPPQPEPDELRVETIHEKLREAGANVTAAAIQSWTSEQRIDAFTWAEAQLAASAKDKPGRHTSVRWPEHVSAAHATEEKPKKAGRRRKES